MNNISLHLCFVASAAVVGGGGVVVDCEDCSEGVGVVEKGVVGVVLFLVFLVRIRCSILLL